MKERRQGRKDFLRTTFTKQVQAAKYDGSDDLSKAKGNQRMLVETVTEGYSPVQPEEGYLKNSHYLFFYNEINVDFF